MGLGAGLSRYAPSSLGKQQVGSLQMPRLTVVTGADEHYSRCLEQMLLSARRHRLNKSHRFVAYDLGLFPETRRRFESKYGWCRFRDFRFEAYPPHVRIAARTYAWKPIAIAEAVRDFGGLVLWLDSATLFHTSDLSEVVDTLRKHGTYSLSGQSPLSQRCSQRVLNLLGAIDELSTRPVRAGGIIGFNADHSAAVAVAMRWAALAINPIYMEQCTERHNADQAVLSILLYQAAAAGELSLNDGEIDISSVEPVRWMSSRNKVPVRIPLWADPLVRAYYGIYKRADRCALRLNRWYATRILGMHRWPKEHFSVYVADCDRRRIAAVRARSLSYYADPFVWRHAGRTWLLVEEFRYPEHLGHLCAIELDDSLAAGSPRPILPLACHASFPFLFEAEGRIFMIPETSAQKTLDLYACEEFPVRWRLARRIMADVDVADSAVFQHEARWWLMASIRDPAIGNQRFLSIFHTDDPIGGTWLPHPMNGEHRFAADHYGHGRNGGSVLRTRGYLLRMMQSNRHYYGESIAIMQIEKLTPTDFVERPFDLNHEVVEIAQRFSPHHISTCGELIAWDVRDRVGFMERLPLLRRCALRPDPRALRLAQMRDLSWTAVMGTA